MDRLLWQTRKEQGCNTQSLTQARNSCNGWEKPLIPFLQSERFTRKPTSSARMIKTREKHSSSSTSCKIKKTRSWTNCSRRASTSIRDFDDKGQEFTLAEIRKIAGL